MDSRATLDFLTSLGLRSLLLFGAAGAVLAAVRVKAADARHAVWTVVAAGLLLLAILSPALPPLPLRWLKAPVEVAQLPNLPAPELTASPAAPPAAPAAPRFVWQDGVVAVYALVALALLGRLAFGYLFTRRLLRASTPVYRFPDTWSSTWISVPITIGRKILLPAEWEKWDEAKLQAVLAHERTHVRRADWAIALVAGVARCVFWFQPLAWWLERHLALLAEHACDDSALLLIESEPYAQALLEMAAAVKTAQGRLIWEAMAMAKAGEVRKRIERILDETRPVHRALGRARWLALAACSLPLIWVAAVAQLAPASAQESPRTPAAMTEFLKGRRQLTQADVAIMEQYLTQNPHDVDVRAQVILYYYSIGVREPRMSHIVWLVSNHPEVPAAAFASSGVLPRENAMNSVADYQRVYGAWKQAVATHQNDLVVLQNAAQFLQAVGQLDEAEAMLQAALRIQPGNLQMKDRLGKLYALAILEGTGDAKFPAAQPAFSSRVRSEIVASEDGNLLFSTGSAITGAARRPTAGRPLTAGVLNLDEHPLLEPAVQLGQQLMERAGQFGGPRVVVMPAQAAPGFAVGGGVVRREGVVGGVPSGVPGGVSGGTAGGVLGGIIGSVPAPAETATQPAPPVVKKVEPEYPPLARQARISGVVRFSVRIAADGTVDHIQVMSGHPLLVPAGLQALKQWEFQRSGAPVNTIIEMPFTLPPGDAPQPMQQFGAMGKAGGPMTAPSMIRVGGNVQAAKLIDHVDPVYPPHARAEGIEGNVTLTITIAEDGHVESAEPVEGNPALAGAAQEAVRQWRYQPTLLNMNPVKVSTTVVVPFQLH
jgi:TonB family protein